MNELDKLNDALPNINHIIRKDMSSVEEVRPLATIPTMAELLQTFPELKMEDITYLRSWMSTQPHLPEIPDDMLVPFLYVNGYSREKAKHTIENHFTMRTHFPELFHNRDPLSEEVKKQMTLCQGGHLHNTDPEGNMVWIGRLLPCPPSEIDFDTCFKIVMMAVDQTVRENPLCPGHILVEDLKEVTMAHIPVIKLGTLRRMFKYIQEGLHVDVKALHVINVSTVVDCILSLIKPFLSKDMASKCLYVAPTQIGLMATMRKKRPKKGKEAAVALIKIHLHSGPIEDLYKVIPQAILPKDYGGNLGDMAEIHEYTLRTLEHNRSWFVENNYFVDETKRPGKATSTSRLADFWGLGTVKKPDVE